MRILLTALSGALLVCSTSLAESLPSGPKNPGSATISDGQVEQANAEVYTPGRVMIGSPPTDPAMDVADTPESVTFDQLQMGQPQPPYGGDLGYRMLDPFGPLYRLDKRIGESFGYDEGYTNIAAFIPKHLDPNRSLLFWDVRALITDDGRGGANVGLGYRYYSCDLDRVFTFAGWWDLDDGHERSYNQAGFSFESLGKYFDARLNGYLPVGEDSHVIDDRVVGGFFFAGNNILLNRQQTTESAFRGLDAEIGGPLPALGKYGLTAHAGAYWFDSKSDQGFAGVSARIGADVTEDLSARIYVTDDDVFGTNLQFALTYTFPNAVPSRWFRPKPVYERLGSQVERRYRVTTHKQIVQGQELAINPADDEPFYVVHIDPNLTSPGTGTYENPYNQLALFDDLAFPQKSIVDIIAVERRDDDTSTNLDTGVTLLDNQRLLSESVPHLISATVGTFALPGFFSPGPNPRLTNPLGNVITLGSNDEVSGFTIEDSPFTGIVGSDIDSFNINRNIIANFNPDITPNANNVVLTNVTGGGSFLQNIVLGDGVSTNSGFQLTNTGVGPLELGITLNEVAGHVGSGFSITADDSDISVGFGNLLLGADGDAIVNGNISTGNLNGLVLTAANGGSITGTVEGNDLTNNDNNGVQMNAITGGTIDLFSFDTNDVSNNGSDNMLQMASSGGTISTPIMNSMFDNGGANGIHVIANAGTVIWPVFSNNSVTGNPGDGILVETLNGGSFMAGTLDTVDFSGTGGTAINISTQGGILDLGTLTSFVFDRTTVGEAGILINAVDTDVSLAVIDGTFLGDPTANPDTSFGMRINVENGSLDLSVVDSVFDQNVDAAIALMLTGDATGELTITGNTITRTRDQMDPDSEPLFEGEGIAIVLEDNAVINPPLISGNTIGSLTDPTLGNDHHGISVVQHDDSRVADMVISDNMVGNNLGNGIDWFRRDDAEVDNVSILRNTIIGNGGTMDSDMNDPDGIDDRAGLRLFVQNGALDTLDFIVNDNIITDNTFRGAFYRTGADAFLRVDMSGNVIEDNISHGVEVYGRQNESTDLANIGGTWVQNSIANNGTTDPLIGGHGVLINANMGTGANTFIIGVDGMDADGVSLGNNITDNGYDGIEINKIGEVFINNNVIMGNGLAASLDATQDGTGIDINNDILVFAPNPLIPINFETPRMTRVELINNTITENAGDGVELLTRSTFFQNPGRITAQIFMNVLALGNTIEENDGRGVDLLISGNGQGSITFGNGTDDGMNEINSNGLEAFYTVFTASVNQNQTDDASVDLLSDGDVRDIPNLMLDLNQNHMRGNGQDSLTFPGTGVVLRVGSVNGVSTFQSDVGTQSGINVGANGRVNARIKDNTFQGNFGVDVLIESFTSTVDPVTTMGTWDETMFVITGIFQQDPVARLNLAFTGNTGNSIDVVRGPADRIIGIDNVAGAFYSNAEGTFKSRLADATPPGPFDPMGGAARRRNATRVTTNDPPFNVPGIPGAAATWEYPGVGDFAFIVENNFQDPFNDPASWSGGGDSFTDIQFFPEPPLSTFGEFPYGWDFTSTAPGTFTFPTP